MKFNLIFIVCLCICMCVLNNHITPEDTRLNSDPFQVTDSDVKETKNPSNIVDVNDHEDENFNVKLNKHLLP